MPCVCVCVCAGRPLPCAARRRRRQENHPAVLRPVSLALLIKYAQDRCLPKCLCLESHTHRVEQTRTAHTPDEFKSQSVGRLLPLCENVLSGPRNPSARSPRDVAVEGPVCRCVLAPGIQLNGFLCFVFWLLVFVYVCFVWRAQKWE